MANENLPELKFDDMPELTFGRFRPFLPKYEEVEEKIESRPDLLGGLARKVSSPGYLKSMPGRMLLPPPFGTIGDIMQGQGGVAQRAEAAIANPMMQAQEDMVSPDRRAVEAGVPLLGAMRYTSNIKKGITGERLGEFGDSIRRTAFGGPANEALASTAGFFAAMKMVDPITQGLLVDSANKAAKYLGSKVPRIMGKNYTVNRAAIGLQGLDEVYDALEKRYDDMYTQVGNRTVDVEGFQDVVNELPPNIQAQLRQNLKLFDRFKDGSVKHTISNLKTVRNLIRKNLPKNVLNSTVGANEFQGNLKYLINKIRGLEKVATKDIPEFRKLQTDYSKYKKMDSKLRRVFADSTTGEPRSKGVEEMFKPGAERLVQQHMEEFAGIWPQAAQIMKDTIKFTKRQSTKQAFRRATPWLIGTGAAVAGGGYMGRRWLENVGVGGGPE